MTRISSPLTSLIGGVSQQSPALRLSSQCESMVNWYPSPVDGLVKRPPTELVARLDVAPTAPLLYHLIERDERERYHVIISEGRVRVWTLEGEERPVKGGEDSYLNVADPQRGLRVVTSQDYTFILNTSVKVEESEERFPERAHEALVFIKQGVAETTYSVTVNASTFSYSLPSDSASIASVTANLASQLSGAGYSVVYDRSVILVRHSSAFTLKVSDSKGGSCIDSFTNRTQSFSSLPAIAADGFILEISGDSNTGYDNHFVRFETDSGEVMDKGVWVECPKPGSTRGFRASTMPRALVRLADGSFELQCPTWGEREAGDEESSPMPSFVGNTIQDIFFYKNRMGLLSGSNVILSRASELFSFFPASATTLLDSDPVDTAACSIKVNILRFAMPLQEQLILFSDSTQYRMDDSMETFGPKTAALLPMTEFSSSSLCRPESMGRSLFFTADRGEYSDLREFTLADSYAPNDAPLMTSHVPRYVPSGVSLMRACRTEEALLLLAPSEPSRLRLYKSLWSGNEKIQSAWGLWDFGSRHILGMGWITNTLYLLVTDGDGLYVERLTLESDARDTGLNWKILLDRRITEASCFLSHDAATESTRITLPYTPEARPSLVTRDTGRLLAVLEWEGRNVTVAGNHEATPLFIGLPYEARFRFSPPVASSRSSGEKIVIGDSRLQIRSWMLNYDRSGSFHVEVTPSRRSTGIYKSTGSIVGSAESRIGTVPLESGRLMVPVLSKSDRFTLDIVSTGHLPCRITSAEWVGELAQHSRRL